MQRIYAEKYIEIGKLLGMIEMAVGFPDDHAPRDGGKISSEIVTDEIKGAIKDLIEICDTINFKVSGDILSKAYDDIPRTIREFNIVSGAVISELQSGVFLYVPSEKSSFFENESVVSDEALAAFPKASSELRLPEIVLLPD